MTAEELEKEYRDRPDGELLRLALTPEQLTPEANTALASELARRGIAADRRLNLESGAVEPNRSNQEPRIAGGLARTAYLSSVQELRESWLRLRSLSAVKQVAILAVALFLIGAPCWRILQDARSGELELLYNSAFTGNLESVKKLSSYRLFDGTDLLERLARDRDADAYARVAAIKELSDHRFANPRPLVPLLWVDVPYVVRHETAQFFLSRGCGDECTRMSLDSLHAMWTGHPMLEAELPPIRGLQGADDKKLIADLRGSSEADYLRLLNSNPCGALRILGTDYSSDPAFASKLRPAMKPC